MHAAREKGLKVGLVNTRSSVPFPDQAVSDACAHAKEVLCVEMNMGQMIDDVKLAIRCSKPVHFFGRTGGVIPKPSEVLHEIHQILGGND